MSILQVLSQRLVGDPLKLSLVAGVVSSSYFLYGNLGAANIGIVPAIQDVHGVDLPIATKVALWKWFYGRGHVCKVICVSAGYY